MRTIYAWHLTPARAGKKCAHRERLSYSVRQMPVVNGGVAQMGEHLPCKQGVAGSSPATSTTPP